MKHSSPSIIAAMILFFILPTIGFSQSTEMNPEKDELRKPYHPDANAQADIDSLVLLTQQDGKHIVIQAGETGVFGVCVLMLLFTRPLVFGICSKIIFIIIISTILPRIRMNTFLSAMHRGKVRHTAIRFSLY